MWGLLCVAPIYYAVRISDLWSGRSAVELVRLVINEALAPIRSSSAWTMRTC